MSTNTKKFRLSARNFLLTYPQSGQVTKEDLRDFLLIQGCTQYIVCSETHQDGTPHLHAYCVWENKLDTTNQRFLDFSGLHPNIKVAKNKTAQVNFQEYCRKGGNFITNFNDAPKTERQLFAEEIISKGLTKETVTKFAKIAIFTNFNSILAWSNFCSKKTSRPLTLPKRRHIWICGPSNTGKTFWLEAYKQLWDTVIEIPTNNDWSHAAIQDGRILYWYDEYKGQLTVDQLNRLCDGEKLFNTKGGSILLHEGWVVITSNYSPRLCYHKVDSEIIRTIENRFHIYDLSINRTFPKFPQSEL